MTKRIRLRSLLVAILFTLSFGFLLFKIYQIQVVEASWLQSEADKRWEQDRLLPATRGTIMDRYNRVLASDTTVYSVTLNPKILDANRIVDEVVKGLTDILVDSSSTQVRSALKNKIQDRATKRKTDGALAISVELRNEGWKIPKSKADQILALSDSLKQKYELRGNIGIYVTEEKGRYYPGDSLAAHVLGYLDKDGNAKLGLEAKLNNILAGKSGEIKVKTDAKGVEILDSREIIQQPQNGNNVRLTIDMNIQYYVENAIQTIQEKYHPKSISVVALDPTTMEVLAIANTPTFNPNAYWEIDDLSQFKNQAISSQFEPGSTFKLVTLSGAVAEGLFQPQATFQSGSIQVPGATLHDHNRIGWGEISYLDGLKRSSNVAFVKLGYELLGPEKLLDYINKFGFGQKTGIDLPGEIAGSVDAHYPVEYATATYGQGKIVATNIQIATAYAAIANGGKLMKPFILKDVIDSSTNQVIQSYSSQEVRQVIPENIAHEVTNYLEQTIDDQQIGSGRSAFIPGYSVAGKTGTANIVDQDAKGYATGSWMVSFVGFAPADHPRILVSIMVQEPDLGGNYHLSSNVTTIPFKDIVLQSLQYMGVPENNQQGSVSYTDKSAQLDTQFKGLSRESAKLKASQQGISFVFVGNGNEVVDQYPQAEQGYVLNQIMYLFMQPKNQAQLPDLTGKSMKEAIDLCSFVEATCNFTGHGYVEEQSAPNQKDKTFNFKLAPLHDKVESEAKP